MMFPEHPQVVVQPRGPTCGSADTVSRRSQAIPGGVEFRGRQCAAQRQWRVCRVPGCGTSFPVVNVGGAMATEKRSSRWTGPAVS